MIVFHMKVFIRLTFII